MESKEAALIKILSDMGAHEEPPLTPEQERILQQALDPHEDYLSNIEKLFKNTTT